MEAQLTDYENAAFTVFSTLVLRVRQVIFNQYEYDHFLTDGPISVLYLICCAACPSFYRFVISDFYELVFCVLASSAIILEFFTNDGV